MEYRAFRPRSDGRPRRAEPSPAERAPAGTSPAVARMGRITSSGSLARAGLVTWPPSLGAAPPSHRQEELQSPRDGNQLSLPPSADYTRSIGLVTGKTRRWLSGLVNGQLVACEPWSLS